MLDYLWFANVLARVVGIFALVYMYKVCRKSKSENFNEDFTKEPYNKCESADCQRCRRQISHEKQMAVLSKLNETDSENLKRINTWSKNLTEAPPKTRTQHPTVFYLPNLHTNPIIDNLFHSDDVQTLENNHQTILQDFVKISEDMTKSNGWKFNSTPQGSWKVFFLINQGIKIDRNASQCPSTMEILERLSNLLRHCAFGNACFSVVSPNTTIEEHYGPCNVRTRCHLGLQVPSNWTLCVSDKRASWTEGKCILFDDSFAHSVSHDLQSHTSAKNLNLLSSRVVFMVDFWHYNMTQSERAAISKLFPASSRVT